MNLRDLVIGPTTSLASRGTADPDAANQPTIFAGISWGQGVSAKYRIGAGTLQYMTIIRLNATRLR